MPDYLPLFPLDVVLFPEMLLPLHIFEERYKEMISECLRSNSGFGILYAHDHRVETIGCVAEISQVMKRYSDGRMDLVATGRERFQVNFFNSEKTYLRGSVELLPDQATDHEPTESLARQTLELYTRVSVLMGQHKPQEPSSQSSFQGLAFKLASSLPLENGIRQRILEARSEDRRLEELAGHLASLIPLLTERRDAAGRAGSNGQIH
jgi:ATP-dependent Lon protease